MNNLLVFVLVLLGVFLTVQAGELAERRRALELFERLLGKEKRACVAKGAACDWDDRCCDGQCYYAEGSDLNPSNDGRCVDCIKKGQVCQYNKDCCSELQCDSGKFYKREGRCTVYRREGPCYTDGQCVTACVKSGANFLYGECT